ncbi:hypothetical protein DL93DRAFT_960176 [Clavulina sp. PMI_390]|nr:hypothetical protein DL93DRAFT_960176 [Clavulina sp. PMI_390]
MGSKLLHPSSSNDTVVAQSTRCRSHSSKQCAPKTRERERFPSMKACFIFCCGHSREERRHCPGSHHTASPPISTNNVDRTQKMDRLSPSSSSSSFSDPDEPMFEGEGTQVAEPGEMANLDTRESPTTSSNKRRAPSSGPMASQPHVKTRSRRGEESRGWSGSGPNPGEGPSRRGTGPDGRREELVDADLAKYLKRIIGDPFLESQAAPATASQPSQSK